MKILIRTGCVVALLSVPLWGAAKSVVMIAGPKSHGTGQHEHPESCALLARHLESSGLDVKVTVSEGWPADAGVVAGADALVIYSDGVDGHVANGHLAELRRHHEAGKGLVVLHWALEPGDDALAGFLRDAVGGYFDPEWSVNPMWVMKSPVVASHAVTSGVSPFSIEDEFYYHLRFRDEVVPVLSALPPAESLGADGPRSANPAVRKALADGVAQTLAWVVTNANGSRGFGFTGGHYHRNWANPDFRKLVLNAVVWTVGLEVPAGGVEGKVAAAPAYQTIDEAITAGDLADVKLHVARNPESANKGKNPTRPPLAQAVLRNKTEIAVALLEAGANPDVQDASLRTPLHLAVERRNAAVVAALLKAGAKPNVGDKDGWTPLHHAAAKNLVEIGKALLAGKADPMQLSKLGGTPLHEAAASAGADFVQMLLDHKVDPSLKSKEGVTALDIAKKYKNQAAIDVLSKK